MTCRTELPRKVSNHCMVRWLERHYGVDLESKRAGKNDFQLLEGVEKEHGPLTVFFKEVEDICTQALDVGASALRLMRGSSSSGEAE